MKAGMLIVALLLSAKAAALEGGREEWITVDLPHGGCRLTVWSDGSGVLRYGAAPWGVVVAQGSFDVLSLADSLTERSYLPEDVAIRTPEEGSVRLPGAEALRFIRDAAFVRGVLMQAWAARTGPAHPGREEAVAWVGGACGLELAVD